MMTWLKKLKALFQYFTGDPEYKPYLFEGIDFRVVAKPNGEPGFAILILKGYFAGVVYEYNRIKIPEAPSELDGKFHVEFDYTVLKGNAHISLAELNQDINFWRIISDILGEVLYNSHKAQTAIFALIDDEHNYTDKNRTSDTTQSDEE